MTIFKLVNLRACFCTWEHDKLNCGMVKPLNNVQLAALGVAPDCSLRSKETKADSLGHAEVLQFLFKSVSELC